MTILLASPPAALDGGFRHGVTVVRLRASGSGIDPYSNQPTHDWANPSASPISRVAIAPASSDDVTGQNGTWIESTAVLYSRTYDLDVLPQDRIIYHGTTYVVTGEGARWMHPMTGRRAGAAFGLKAIT